MRIYVFCGLPGSTKSTYAKELSEMYPNSRIVNQDILGNRDNCLKKAKEYLNSGFDVIIDRTNINKKQRAHWISLGKEYNAQIECVEFKCDIEECVKRCIARKNHPTIKNLPESKIREIIMRFDKEYEVPNAIIEGFSSHISFYIDNTIRCERNQSFRDRYRNFIKSRINKIARKFKNIFR